MTETKSQPSPTQALWEEMRRFEAFIDRVHQENAKCAQQRKRLIMWTLRGVIVSVLLYVICACPCWIK